MSPNKSVDICVISTDPFLINRIKIFSQHSNLTIEYSENPYYKSDTSLFLIDINVLDAFLTNYPYPKSTKFIVIGDQEDLDFSFKEGCTDFLKNPWNNAELEARIFRALKQTIKNIQWDKLTIYPNSIGTKNTSTSISIEEYIILKKLIENRKEPVPREALLYALWGTLKENSRVVDMHISHLRKKIKILKKQDDLCCSGIKTVRSYGYMIY